MALDEKMIPGVVVRCAKNLVNAMVFVRFHLFTYSVNWMISNRLWDRVVSSFLGTLDSLETIIDEYKMM